MKDSKQGFRSKSGQDQQIERVQLKVVAWALCKESNVASEDEQNVVSSVAAPEKELITEELKTGYVTKDLQKTHGSLCKEDGASGKGQNVVSSHGKKELKGEVIKEENQIERVQKIVVPSSSAEGMKRKPIVLAIFSWC